jgi:hypothetical protein
MPDRAAGHYEGKRYRAEGLGNIGKPTVEIGTVGQSNNEEDAIRQV